MKEDVDEMKDLPSHSEMKKELINAIIQAQKEKEERLAQNRQLQIEIMIKDNSYDHYDRQPEQSNNEHKYLNTLANVHQVRFNLKETQERYNKMASELQAKLNEKQSKCHEIMRQFKELKQAVAAEAVFSRTGKEIP